MHIFFLSVSLYYTLFILITYHTGITSIIPYLWLLHNRIYYWCLIWYILLIQDNTDAKIWSTTWHDMTEIWPCRVLSPVTPGSWSWSLGPGPGEYYQDQDPGPDFSQIWQNNSSSKMTKNLCNIDWIKNLECILWPHQIQFKFVWFLHNHSAHNKIHQARNTYRKVIMPLLKSWYSF